MDLDLYNKTSGKLSDAELKDIFIISKLSLELDVKLTEKTHKHLSQLWTVFADFYKLKEGKVYENFSQITGPNLKSQISFGKVSVLPIIIS